MVSKIHMDGIGMGHMGSMGQAPEGGQAAGAQQGGWGHQRGLGRAWMPLGRWAPCMSCPYSCCMYFPFRDILLSHLVYNICIYHQILNLHVT